MDAGRRPSKARNQSLQCCLEMHVNGKIYKLVKYGKRDGR
jgi:hypothetical protein